MYRIEQQEMRGRPHHHISASQWVTLTLLLTILSWGPYVAHAAVSISIDSQPNNGRLARAAQFCQLPRSFSSSDIVGVRGKAGCAAGAVMPAGTYCAVKCAAGTVPVRGANKYVTFLIQCASLVAATT